MRCAICDQREATVHLTMIEGEKGNIRKMDLCEECAQTKGVNDPTGFSLYELLRGLPTPPPPRQQPPAQPG